MQDLLNTLIKNYMDEVKGALAVTICDRDGLIIASQGGEGDDSLIGAISASLDSYIERIKKEFGTEGNFLNITALGDKKLAYCSMGPNSILTTIADPSTPDVELSVYSKHIAGKIELLLEGKENVSLEIPAIIKALSKTRGGVLPKGVFSSKLIITGDYQVGKTSLIRRYVENRFEDSYISTIGVEISKKVLEVGDETKINLIIWDIGGQIAQMAPYRARFYNGANAAFIVLDRTRHKTLEDVEMWYNDIKKSVDKKIPVVIVGNKSDIETITVSEEDIQKMANKFGFHYILTSCLTGENVNDAFLYVGLKYLENL